MVNILGFVIFRFIINSEILILETAYLLREEFDKRPKISPDYLPNNLSNTISVLSFKKSNI